MTGRSVLGTALLGGARDIYVPSAGRSGTGYGDCARHPPPPITGSPPAGDRQPNDRKAPETAIHQSVAAASALNVTSPGVRI